VDHMDIFDRTASTTANVVAGIKPDQLDAASPCSEWNVRDVLNHLVGTVGFIGDRLAGREVANFDPFAKAPDVIGTDPMAAFDEVIARCRSAWVQRDSLDGSTKLFGDNEAPVAFVWQITVGDILLHGWDLARATGQNYPLPDDVADTMCARFVGKMPDSARGHAFGPAVTVPDDAPSLDQLVAYSGRQP
jgi:uncharacterized protein (TIGR03086 family)